jgi:hypothetical protein
LDDEEGEFDGNVVSSIKGRRRPGASRQCVSDVPGAASAKLEPQLGQRR